MLGSLIDLANSQGHKINDIVKSLYDFIQMAFIPTHSSFGKNKCEAIANLAASSKGIGYIKWRPKQDNADLYSAHAYQQVLESV